MGEKPVRVLVVEDSADDYRILKVMLSKISHRAYVPDNVPTYSGAMERLRRHEHDVYLVDYKLGPDSGLDFLREAVQQEKCESPIILLTGYGGHELDMEAMGLGAADFLSKNNLDPDLLERSIRYALEQAEAREKLRKRTALLGSILENMGDGVAMADQEGRLTFFNPAAEKILGFGPNQRTRENWVKEYGFYLPDRETLFPTEEFPLCLALQGERVENVEIFARNSQIPEGAYLSASARPLKNEKGRTSGGVMVFRDVTALKRAEEQVLRHSLYQPLTGLPNRALFLDRVGQAVQRQKRDDRDFFTVLFLSLVGIKKINDTFGETAGDQLLKESGKRLEGLMGHGDTAAHLGGNEFAVLLGGSLGEEQTKHFVEKTQKAFREPFQPQGNEVFLDAFIGVVAPPSHYDHPQDVVRDARVAMHWARSRSKNGYEIFRPAMLAGAVESLQMENDLRHALERKELIVYYQPIVSLETGLLSGFEALLRWKHPVRGMVSPVDFIPLAEETGLILPIGEWVLQESCRQRRLWLEQFPEQSSFSISVNLSAKQFIQKDLVGGVLGHLKEHRLQPEHMNLEITESVVMENFDAARQILGQLKNEHIHLHLDDFGTGYSSLSQLHRFPLDVLKIDQSFVKRMTGGDEGIVRTIITLAHELGMGMIAEGVETAESFEKLKSLKCTEAQGYFFAKPLEPLVAEELLTAGTRWGAHG
jgi:diguanylate cyclase (GGDEF)-like protein